MCVFLVYPILWDTHVEQATCILYAMQLWIIICVITYKLINLCLYICVFVWRIPFYGILIYNRFILYAMRLCMILWYKLLISNTW